MNRDECMKIVADAQAKDLHADLSSADLRDADLRSTDLSYANLSGANLSNANLRGAVLSDADLRGADLRYADLRGANIDFAAWPLWCGGTNAKLDDRGACQLAYHAYNQDYQDPASLAAIEPIRPMAQRFIDVYRHDTPALRAPWVG